MRVLPTPPITPVNKAPSVPNLTRLISSLSGSYSSSRSSCVGPPSKSPKDPICSTSPTNTLSAKPPDVAAAINFAVLPLALSSAAFLPALTRFGLSRTKYFFNFLDCKALLARLAPLVKAIPPGTPMLTNVSVIFPIVVASAFSSKSVRSSNHFSTSTAFLVSAPKSIRDAPRENKPLGMAIRPDPTPASMECMVPILLYFSELSNCVSLNSFLEPC